MIDPRKIGPKDSVTREVWRFLTDLESPATIFYNTHLPYRLREHNFYRQPDLWLVGGREVVALFLDATPNAGKNLSDRTKESMGWTIKRCDRLQKELRTIHSDVDIKILPLFANIEEKRSGGVASSGALFADTWKNDMKKWLGNCEASASSILNELEREYLGRVTLAGEYIIPNSEFAREAVSLLMKDMLCGLNVEELSKFRSHSGQKIRTVEASACPGGDGGCITIFNSEDLTRGALVTAAGERVLRRTSHSRKFLAGILHPVRSTSSFDKEEAMQVNEQLIQEDFLDIEEPSDSQRSLSDDSAPSDPRETEEEQCEELGLEGGSSIGLSWIALGESRAVSVAFAASSWCPAVIEGPNPVHAWREQKYDATFNVSPGTVTTHHLLPLGDHEKESHKIVVKVTLATQPIKNLSESTASSYTLIVSVVEGGGHAQRLTNSSLALEIPKEQCGAYEEYSEGHDPAFKDLPTYAVGHNSAATWKTSDSKIQLKANPWPVHKTPRLEHIGEVEVGESLHSIRNKLDDYKRHLENLPWVSTYGELNELQGSSSELIEACYEGLSLLETNSRLLEVFRDAERVIMCEQVSRCEDSWQLELKNRRWRLFQILFFLASFPSTIDTLHPRRKEISVIEFPTGGGKTEAYLLLSIFTILNRRREEDKNIGASVLMRYPLRLLAAQQMQRAAKAIVVANVILRSKPEVYFGGEIKIGMWAGESLTPNTVSGLVAKTWKTRVPFVACPLCGCEMKLEPSKDPTSDLFFCPTQGCFAGEGGEVPIGRFLLFTDEQLYQRNADFVVSTLDKIAIAPWRISEKKSDRTTEHGIERVLARNLPLVIQDELHMIDDELGSMEGLYQLVFEAIYSRGQSDTNPGPKIVAASATTKNTTKQISLLYNRESLLRVPAKECEDNHWYVAKPTREARHWTIGIYYSERISKKDAIEKIINAGFCAVNALHRAVEEGFNSGRVSEEDYYNSMKFLDPFWTNLVFFGSRTTLRLAASTSQQDSIRERTKKMAWSLGYTGKQRLVYDRGILEASSESTASMTEIITRLSTPVTATTKAADLCLATSMIEVGVDVDRLGLMTFVGHPKETNSYIQASGRIAREHPGLIYSLYSPTNKRDGAVFEDFLSIHQRLGEKIEPALLNPYTPGAVRRVLPAILATRIRMTYGSNKPSIQDLEKLMDEVLQEIVHRGRKSFTEEPTWLRQAANELLNIYRTQEGNFSFVTDRKVFTDPDSKGLLVPFTNKVIAEARKNSRPTRWTAPTSLRTVTAESRTYINKAHDPHASASAEIDWSEYDDE